MARGKGSRSAARNAWARLGLQARPGDVVAALAAAGVAVTEETVRSGRVALLKEQTDAARPRLPVPATRAPRRPPRLPPRRGR
jgi:hypothetical protein